VHGSAPDLAGSGTANPTAMLRSTALLLEHGLGLHSEARALTHAVDAALESVQTPDLGGTATTAELGAEVREQLTVDRAATVPYGG
jgi:isocitrate/isopropylmalate dehydrogenase